MEVDVLVFALFAQLELLASDDYEGGGLAMDLVLES